MLAQANGAAAGEEIKDPWGIPEFTPALEAALRPHKDEETTWDFEEMCTQVAKKIAKATSNYRHSERLTQRGNHSEGRVVVEEFVESVMTALNGVLYDKAWFMKVDFTAPLVCAANHLFKTQKVFARTLKPIIEKHVQEALLRYMEEERHGRCIWDAVENAGVKETYRKKCRGQIATAYDVAHTKGPWGTLTGDNAEMILLKEFVKGWIYNFVKSGWETLYHGLEGEGEQTRDQQLYFTAALFQTLTNRENAVLPNDLTSLIDTPPPSPWPFVAEACEQVFQELEEHLDNKKNAKPTANKPWKNWGGGGQQSWGGAWGGGKGYGGGYGPAFQGWGDFRQSYGKGGGKGKGGSNLPAAFAKKATWS